MHSLNISYVFLLDSANGCTRPKMMTCVMMLAVIRAIYQMTAESKKTTIIERRKRRTKNQIGCSSTIFPFWS